MGDVVELLRHENAFVAGVGRRLGKAGVVDIISGAPREISPMGAGFEDVVLEIVFVQQDEATFVAQAGECFEAVPVPGIVFAEVVSAQAIPGGALAAAGERQLVERWPNIAVGTADTFVIIAAAVVPEAVMVVDGGDATGGEQRGEFRKIIGETGPGAAGDETREAGFGERSFGGTNVAAPPGDVCARADEEFAGASEPAVREVDGLSRIVVPLTLALSPRRGSTGDRRRGRKLFQPYHVAHVAGNWIARRSGGDEIGKEWRGFGGGGDELGGFFSCGVGALVG